MKTPIVLKTHKSQILLSLLFVSGLIWIFGSFFSQLSFPDSGYNFFGTTNKVKLDPGAPVTQVFTAKDDNLNQIKIIVGNSNLKIKEKITFELFDESCQTILASDAITFITPEPHIYYHFNFPSIPNSEGRKYCLVSTYYSPYDKGGDRPYLAATEDENLFRGWSYTNTGNGRIYENRTLQMRPSYGTGSFLGDLQQFNNRLSQYKPEFLKGSFLTALILSYMLGTISLAWVLISRKEE